MKPLGAAALSIALVAALVGMAVVASGVSFLRGAAGTPIANAEATARIPSAMLALYQEAASTCPGLPWTVLAAIGTVESDNGQSELPGVHSGANSAGAEGMMQFEPATFSPGNTSRRLRWTTPCMNPLYRTWARTTSGGPELRGP